MWGCLGDWVYAVIAAVGLLGARKSRSLYVSCIPSPHPPVRLPFQHGQHGLDYLSPDVQAGLQIHQGQGLLKTRHRIAAAPVAARASVFALLLSGPCRTVEDTIRTRAQTVDGQIASVSGAACLLWGCLPLRILQPLLADGAVRCPHLEWFLRLPHSRQATPGVHRS